MYDSAMLNRDPERESVRQPQSSRARAMADSIAG